MENKHSSDGIAEDIMRSFIQMGNTELHLKTLLEKRISELENGLIDLDTDLAQQLEKISDIKQELVEAAQLRREDMLYLFELYGSNGDKERWCLVKHYGNASMTAFEAWQASDNDERLLDNAIRKNKLLLKNMSLFLGVEVTECAACFADILKGGE